jgi:hypothetical protein
MADYSLGIEIEVCAEPHKIRPPLREKHALYYEKLAAALRNRGLKARANDLQEPGRKYPDNYTRWWITKDISLKGTDKTSELPLDSFGHVHGADYDRV